MFPLDNVQLLQIYMADPLLQQLGSLVVDNIGDTLGEMNVQGVRRKDLYKRDTIGSALVMDIVLPPSNLLLDPTSKSSSKRDYTQCY